MNRWPTLLALVIAFAPPAAAQGFNCAQASTAVERGICADPGLRKLDAAVSAMFADAMAATQGTTRQALRAQQRAWLQQRDKTCPTGAAACLTPLYRDRSDALNALTARISHGNPTLDNATAVALLGRWSVDGYLVPGQPGRQVSAKEKPSDLPDPGTTLTGHPGELCNQADECLAFGLDRQAIADVTDGDQLAASLHLPPTTPFYVTYLGGKMEYGLIPQPDGSLLAQFNLCDATYTNCSVAFQRWKPASPDAAIRVLAQ